MTPHQMKNLIESTLGKRLDAIEKRLAEIEKVSKPKQRDK